MNVLDLFSGIGGFSLGLERAGMRTVAFCEIEPFCQAVLRKHWPGVPIFDDVRKLTASDLSEPIDVICGGYPCQPFSVAGKRMGAADHRHLWPEYFRLVKELRPTWVIGENVAGHINMGLDAVLSDLEGEGYATRTFVIPACAVDAKHRRDRTWIVGYADRNRRCADHGRGSVQNKERNGTGEKQGWVNEQQRACNAGSLADSESKQDWRVQQRGLWPNVRNCGCPGVVSNASGERLAGQREIALRISKEYDDFSDYRGWEPEPAVGRVAHGVPNRVDRLKALGNAVVPQIPEIIGRAIMKAEAA